jgi:hypothetical protein
MSAGIEVDMAAFSAAQLVSLLLADKSIESAGFRISADEPLVAGADVWVTNRYGLDCALFPLTEAGCEKIKHLVESYVECDEANQLVEVE